MTKILKKYLGVLAALPFLLAPTVSSGFELPTFAVGIGLTGSAVEVTGQETDPEGTAGAVIVDNAALESALIFGEARFSINDRFGLTAGVSLIPGDYQFVSESKRDSDLSDKATGTTVGTSKITGEISELKSVYLQPTVRLTDVFSVYLTAGLTSMDVKGTAALVTSTDFNKTVAVDGTRYGGGVMMDLDNGVFIKLEGNSIAYDDFTFTTSDSTVAKVSNLDEENVTLLIGKGF